MVDKNDTRQSTAVAELNKVNEIANRNPEFMTYFHNVYVNMALSSNLSAKDKRSFCNSSEQKASAVGLDVTYLKKRESALSAQKQPPKAHTADSLRKFGHAISVEEKSFAGNQFQGVQR